MTWVAWLIPPLALAAGWLFWTRLPAGVDDHDDPLETGFASLLAGVLLTGCLALLLAEIGILRPLVLAGAIAAACVALGLLPRRSPRATPVSRSDAAAMALVSALALATLAPASEEVLGGRDEGVYTSIAAWVAGHGTLRIHSGALASIAPDARGVFHGGNLFPGFYIGEAAEGEVFPQFLHLHPIYMALGFWLGGLTAALFVPPIYGLLAHLATFLLVRRLLGTWPAIVASLVLAMNMAQVWVLRTTFSEGAAQFTAAAGLWCLARAAATSGVRWGVVGGLAMGAGFLIRVDAVLLLVALPPALAVLHASTSRPVAWATLAFVPLTLGFAGWGLLHGRVFTPTYMAHMDHYLGPLSMLIGVLLALYAGSLVLRRHARALADRVYRRGVWFWAAAALLVAAALVFGLWIRPHFDLHQGRRGNMDETMVRVAWYFSMIGMLTAGAGVVILLRRWLVDRRIEWVPFLAVFLAISAAYLWNPRVAIDHPWAMRRFVPVILPGIAVGFAAAFAWLWYLRARWRTLARIAALAVLAVVLIHEARLTGPYWTFREKAGAIAQLTEIASHIPEDALLLHTTGVEPWLATPLAFVFGYDSLPVLRRPRVESADQARRLFEAQVLRWLEQGREVYYLTEDEGHWLHLTHHLRWEPVAGFSFVVNRAGLYRTEPPAGPTRRTDGYHLVRVTPAPAETPPCAGLTLDATEPVFGRTQGFHAVERGRDGRFRWTHPESRVLFPACDRRRDGAPATLRVRARCSRATVEAPCRIAVTVNAVSAGALDLTTAWKDHALPIPAAAVAEPQGALEVGFSGPGFRPGRSGRVRDRRVLSFQVQEVSLASGPPQPPQRTGPVRFGVRSAS